MLTLDECEELTYRCFPNFLLEQEDFKNMVRLTSYALNKSYQQLEILKYAYYPTLVDKALLPRLSDTLSFEYPLGYPIDQLRPLIQYLMKIKRYRGTKFSMTALI